MTWPSATRLPRPPRRKRPGTHPTPITNTLAVSQGWTIEQTLILLVALALVALILVPGGLLSRRLERRKR